MDEVLIVLFHICENGFLRTLFLLMGFDIPFCLSQETQVSQSSPKPINSGPK